MNCFSKYYIWLSICTYQVIHVFFYSIVITNINSLQVQVVVYVVPHAVIMFYVMSKCLQVGKQDNHYTL